jgi:hypothetical protein
LIQECEIPFPIANDAHPAAASNADDNEAVACRKSLSFGRRTLDPDSASIRRSSEPDFGRSQTRRYTGTEKFQRSAGGYGSGVLGWLPGAELLRRNASEWDERFNPERSWYGKRRHGWSEWWEGGEVIFLLASWRVCGDGGGGRL